MVQLPLLGVTPQTGEVVDSSPPTKPGRKVRILVVDDNVDALEMLVEALRLLGHDAYAAADAEAALALAGTLQPSIALLDIGLPIMDGYQLGQRLKALPNLAEIKLVALTGYGQTSDRERSRDAGFSAHLVKPVDLAAVDALLNELTAD